MPDLSELTENELWIEYELVEGLEKAHVLDHLYLNSMRDGNFQQALTLAEQSSSIYGDLGTERESFYCKFGMANALQSMQNFEDAIALFVECEEWASLFGEDDEQATIWEHLGDCFVAVGNPVWLQI